MAATVERDGAHGAVLFIVFWRGLGIVGVPEIIRCHGFRAEALHEILSAVAHHQHMRRLLHHQPRRMDRIFDRGHRRHRAGAQSVAVHDGGVGFHEAGSVGDGAASRVERARILERAHHAFHNIQARSTGRQFGTRIGQRSFHHRQPLGAIHAFRQLAAMRDDGEARLRGAALRLRGR